MESCKMCRKLRQRQSGGRRRVIKMDVATVGVELPRLVSLPLSSGIARGGGVRNDTGFSNCPPARVVVETGSLKMTVLQSSGAT